MYINKNNGIVYLSRRNLLTLLSKLDRVKAGDISECTIIKFDNKPKFKQSPDTMIVQAVEDDVYYSEQKPGDVFPADDPKNKPV